MLERGEIDAIYTARVPDSFFSAPDKVGRLFADSMAAERDYFQRSGIYPPMHLICVKRRFVEANPPPPARAVGSLRRKPKSGEAATPRQRDAGRRHALAGAASGGDEASGWRKLLGHRLRRQSRDDGDPDPLPPRRGLLKADVTSEDSLPASLLET